MCSKTTRFITFLFCVPCVSCYSCLLLETQFCGHPLPATTSSELAQTCVCFKHLQIPVCCAVDPWQYKSPNRIEYGLEPLNDVSRVVNESACAYVCHCA